MPRDSQGNYTLPAGNPVVSGTVITSTWANTTMDDIAIGITDSLDRQGRGGMLAPFQFADGNVSAPGATWTNEPTSGDYRAGAGDLRRSILATDVMRWLVGQADIWTGAAWETIATTVTALLKSGGTMTGDIDMDGNSIIGAAVTENAQTGTAYQLVLADSGKLVTMDNAAANTLTVPDNATEAFPIGTRIEVGSIGAGQTTIAAGGSTVIDSKNGDLLLTAQYSGATLTKRGTDLWWLVGDLTT